MMKSSSEDLEKEKAGDTKLESDQQEKAVDEEETPWEKTENL